MNIKKKSIDPKMCWLEAGYEMFIEEGPFNIKVEKLSRIVGKSKSSFYNLFPDLEGFLEELLDHHAQSLAHVNEEFTSCKSFDPEYIDKLVEHKKMLFFNKQLLINRHYKPFGLLFDKEINKGKKDLLGLVSQYLDLDHSKNLASIILEISIENFYLQINKENLSYKFIKDFIFKFRLLARELAKRN